MVIKIENASVKVDYVYTKDGELQVSIVVNDKYRHLFDQHSNVARSAKEEEKEILESKLNGGTYFFSSQEPHSLVDFRYSTYTGFIRSDEQIKELGSIVGMEGRASKTPVKEMFMKLNNTNAVFFGQSDNFYLDVKGLEQGGEFANKIIYGWSPFSKDIETTLEVQRLVCLNGMMSNSPIASRAAPMINDIERNMKILERNLIPTMSNMLDDRFLKMTKQRAVVSDVLRVNMLLKEKIMSDEKLTPEEMLILENLQKLTSLNHLRDIYTEDVFDFTGSKSKQAVSDLMLFDLFNMVTEAQSHTKGSNHKINAMASKLLFDTNKIDIVSNVNVSDESDHRRVFFGQ